MAKRPCGPKGAWRLASPPKCSFNRPVWRATLSHKGRRFAIAGGKTARGNPAWGGTAASAARCRPMVLNPGPNDVAGDVSCGDAGLGLERPVRDGLAVCARAAVPGAAGAGGEPGACGGGEGRQAAQPGFIAVPAPSSAAPAKPAEASAPPPAPAKPAVASAPPPAAAASAPAASAAAAATDQADAAAAPAPAAAPPAPACDVQACAAAYYSFRATDCTYQPYDGPRRLCTKGTPPAQTQAKPGADATPSGVDARAQAPTCNVAACEGPTGPSIRPTAPISPTTGRGGFAASERRVRRVQ